jgi:hypothetical protein
MVSLQNVCAAWSCMDHIRLIRLKHHADRRRELSFSTWLMLTSVMLREWFPCSFCLVSRSDVMKRSAMHIFYELLEEYKVESISLR